MVIRKNNELSERIIILGDLNVDFLNIPPSHIKHDILQLNNLTNIYTNQRESHIPCKLSHDLKIAETGTLQTDARLSDHRATYISLKVEKTLDMLTNAKFGNIKMLIQNN